VLRHATILLVIVGLLAQANPLRWCAVEQLVFGANCHGDEAAGPAHLSHGTMAAATAADERLEPIAGHPDSCICESPSSPQSSGATAATSLIAAMAPVSMATCLQPLQSSRIDPPPQGPTSALVAVSLPLLN
jgi:hypothetical protein